MLKPLLGSEAREKALIFLSARGTAYASEIAEFFNISFGQIQKQLDTLEIGSVLVSQRIGRTRLYEFNPRYTFLPELKSLLAKTLLFYPQDVQGNLTMNRRRPRRRNKPL